MCNSIGLCALLDLVAHTSYKRQIQFLVNGVDFCFIKVYEYKIKFQIFIIHVGDNKVLLMK